MPIADLQLGDLEWPRKKRKRSNSFENNFESDLKGVRFQNGVPSLTAAGPAGANACAVGPRHMTAIISRRAIYMNPFAGAQESDIPDKIKIWGKIITDRRIICGIVVLKSNQMGQTVGLTTRARDQPGQTDRFIQNLGHASHVTRAAGIWAFLRVAAIAGIQRNLDFTLAQGIGRVLRSIVQSRRNDKKPANVDDYE